MITVNANGQVTLPARERRRLGFAPGASLCVVEQDDGLFLRKATPVSDSALEKIRRIAEAETMSTKELIGMCREIKSEVFREDYENELAVRKMQKLEKEVDSGRRKLIPLDVVLRKAGIKRSNL